MSNPGAPVQSRSDRLRLSAKRTSASPRTPRILPLTFVATEVSSLLSSRPKGRQSVVVVVRPSHSSKQPAAIQPTSTGSQIQSTIVPRPDTQSSRMTSNRNRQRPIIVAHRPTCQLQCAILSKVCARAAIQSIRESFSKLLATLSLGSHSSSD